MFEHQNEIKDLGVSPISVVEEMAKEIRDKSDVECNFYQLAKDVPDPRHLSSKKKNLMVFSDLLLEKQNTCHSYYVWGSNVDCFYLEQNSFKLPRQTIRENANFICLFPQDLKNLNHIFEDHVPSDMTRKNSSNYVRWLEKKQHGFVFIDLSSKNTAVNMEVDLTSCTDQIKLKFKTNIIFSLQNGATS